MNSNIRPGTAEGQTIPGFDYVKGRHARFRAICGSDREQRRWEEAVTSAAQALETAALRCRIAMLMTHGGHVERGTLARAGLSADMDPEQILDLCTRDLPTTLSQSAVVKSK